MGQESKRNFQLLVKAEELCEKTIRITSNPKKFPKKYRISLCYRMQDKAMTIYEKILDANRQAIGSTIREELQSNVVAECDKLLFYIKLSIRLNIIPEDSAESWSKLASDIKHITLGWREGDKKRSA